MNKLLTQGFSSFLRRRRAKGHFERRPLLETLTARPSAARASASAPQTRALPSLCPDLLTAAHDEPAQALQRLASQADGLDEAEAARRLARDGPNESQHEAPLPGWLRLWHCCLNPFNLLLTALALLSFASADSKATVVISFLVALSAGIRFVQEGRSHRAADGSRALVTNTATVLRRGAAAAVSTTATPKTRDIAVRELVAGDVVNLSAGDMIPADCRVLSARDLFVAQAAMIGESLQVEKFVQPLAPGAAAVENAAALDVRNLVFMGANVVSGTATALVVATGGRTVFGMGASRASAAEAAPHAFQAGVNSVCGLCIRFAAVMAPIVFFVNGFTKGDWLQAFLFARSVAVGLAPEMLPMIVTGTLAKGAVLLSRTQVVVKRLDAIQNFGAMDVLCTDKTGTLTQDKVALARHADAWGADTSEVLNFAYLNSHYQTGLKNLLDRAVLDHVELAVELQLKDDCRKVDEVPFDFQRRRMSGGGGRVACASGTAPPNHLQRRGSKRCWPPAHRCAQPSPPVRPSTPAWTVSAPCPRSRWTPACASARRRWWRA